MNYQEIENEDELIDLLNSSQLITSIAFQSINFQKADYLLEGKIFADCIFLGCKLPVSFENLLQTNNLVFPEIDLPFNPYTGTLYNRATLLGEYETGKPESYENTLDKRVYNHYIRNGKEAKDIKETLSRRLHDHAISDALYDFLDNYEEKKIVAIMGGHSLLRNTHNYLEVARISKKLTELGYLMISGGGPGAMEATHLGVWFADQDETKLKAAIKILSEAPGYNHKHWLDKAFRVINEFQGSNYESIGIPTWLYGHEPPSPFASQIAKYFANSIREDGLLAIAKGGVIFAPGGAGTIQEIFQDATQNNYLSFGFSSPMVFFDSYYWKEERPVYPLLTHMAKKNQYKNMILSCHDKPEDIVTEILKFTKC